MRWALLLGVTLLAVPAEAQVVPIALPAPWGPFNPGVTTLVVTDSTRTIAGIGARPVLVRLWYPAEPAEGDGVTRPYMPGAVADAWRGTMPAPPGFEAAVRTNTLRDPPLSNERERWPVLLFSHGRSFPVENYQIVLEQLASDGWVVAAISHPQEEALTLLPSGAAVPFGGPRWDHDSLRGAVLMRVVDDLVRDAGLVLDRLAELNADSASPFRERLDMERGVGYFGHSLGGAAAVWALQRDDRVAAAASWEGQVYRDSDRPLPVRRPLLYLIAGANREELLGTQFRPAPVGGPVYEVVIAGAWHASFGDMLHIYRFYADSAWHARHRRELEPFRVNQITVEYLDEFFGHHLLDRDLDLLWPDSAEELGSPRTWNYPEVELRVYSGK